MQADIAIQQRSLADGTKFVEIGGVSLPVAVPRAPELVPHVLFYDIPRHGQSRRKVVFMSFVFVSRFCSVLFNIVSFQPYIGLWKTRSAYPLVVSVALWLKLAHIRLCSQLHVLREIMKDIQLGERHILLIGNQGTGKNKLGVWPKSKDK